MSAGLLLKRTKPTAVDDADPSLGVFTPPPAEILVVSGLGRGVRVGLVYSAVGFTATVTPFFRNSTDGTWFSGTSQSLVPHRRLVIEPDSGAHDVWIRLTAILGGTPIAVWMEEVALP
ncbi:MAG: hypothetical protein ACRD1X_17890 [Vicinamibacteria bacterium]